jgi:hypothetical protein
MYFTVVMIAVIAHFAFIIYLVVGGLVALRWRRTIALHVFVVIWAVASVVLHLPCPLTTIERWGRRNAGMAPLPPDGFIAHYITGVIYPSAWVGAVETIAFAVVGLSWILYWRHGRRLASHRQ